MKIGIAYAGRFSHVAIFCVFGGALLSVPLPASAASTTLTIGGSPASSATVGSSYSFQPTAKDTVRSRIKFDIYNKPAWATFDGTTGRLSGKPTRRDVGTYGNITIRLTDWYGYVTTPAFSITVANPPPAAPPAPANNVPTISAELSWTPPLENTDGSVLTNLSGYKVYYGNSPDALTQVKAVGNAGLTRYVIDDLPSGKWYFAVTSVASDGAESQRSPVVSTTIL
jgi:hypothetical protein